MKLLLRIKNFDWASAAFMVFFVGGIWVLNTHAEILPSINNLPERLKLEDEFAQTNQPPSEQQQDDTSEQSADPINQLFDLPQDANSSSGEEESSEATFTLQEVNFAGNTFFTSEELQVAVQDFLQQELGFTGLRELASAVSQFYQNQGWWARATIPPQDIVDGIVLVEVIEAKLGEVQIVDEGKSQSLSAKLIDQFIHFNLTSEEILNVQTLSENITRLNDLPGIGVRPPCKPDKTKDKQISSSIWCTSRSGRGPRNTITTDHDPRDICVYPITSICSAISGWEKH
jgi:hemolysin activation/secretion protein